MVFWLEQVDKTITTTNIFNLLNKKYSKTRDKRLLVLSSWFYRLGITPNFLTLFALLLAILGGSLILYKQINSAVLVFLLFWFFSRYDGIYARHTASESRFGEIFNNTINMLGELFLLIPILVDCINSASYLIGNVLLGLLALRLLIITLRIQLRVVRVKTNALFFGRAGFYWLILLGVLVNQLPLAAIISTIFLTVTLLQLLARSYYMLYRTSPRIQIKMPIKPARKKGAAAHKKKKVKKSK